MRVFITGGTGYVGAHIVLALLERGDSVTLLARNPKKIPAFVGRPGIAFVAGGMENVEAIRESLPGHDACIHNAILWGDEQAELELQDTRAAVALFEAAAKVGLEQILYTSSTAVHRPFTSGMSEEDRLQTNDMYGATKATGEMFLSAISHQFPVRCNVIRPGPVVGPPAVPGTTVNCSPKFMEFLDVARNGKDISVPKEDGRQFVAASDLAKLYAAVLHEDLNRQTYLGVAQEFTTWESIARQCISVTSSRSNLIVGEESGPPPTFDVSKIERDFGFQFQTADAIQELIAYLSTQH